MASRVKFSLLAALFIVLAVVVAAHDGHDHLAPAEPPSSYASTLSYHAVIGGFVPFLITLLIARKYSL